MEFLVGFFLVWFCFVLLIFCLTFSFLSNGTVHLNTFQIFVVLCFCFEFKAFFYLSFCFVLFLLELGVGDMAKISYHNFLFEISRFMILSQFFVMLVFLFCKLFEHYSQTNFPIIKTKPFKVTQYKKEWWIFRPKWAKIKIFVIILSVIKNKKKDAHYEYTWYTNKTNSVLFSGTIGVFSRSIQEIDWTNIQI